jgi:malonate decarboxylase beta subunit
MTEATSIWQQYVERDSFVERNARERAFALLDEGSGRELCGPFERLESPWLEPQGVVPQSDDGVVVVKGRLDADPCVVVAIAGPFQGGSIGEVSGMKITAALQCAAEDARHGVPISAALLLESGGVRLQEANLGLNAIAEISSALLELRELRPVIGVVVGGIGCFGGTGIVAGLCSRLIVTHESRLGLNGPEVIATEHGIDEFDYRDRRLVWAVNGGAQRFATGLADALVLDDLGALRDALRLAVAAGVPPVHRSQDLATLHARLDAISTAEQPAPGDRPARWTSTWPGLPELDIARAPSPAELATGADGAQA